MNTAINFDKITPQSIATMAITHQKDQARVDHICTLAFHGNLLVADTDSILHKAVIILSKKASEFRKDKKAGKIDKSERFQAINMLSTMIGRWAKKQARLEGRRVSIKSSGKVSVALVTRNDANHKPKGKTANSVSKKDSGIKGVKDLASLLAYAVDNYGLESVVAEVEKLATDPAQVAKVVKAKKAA